MICWHISALRFQFPSNGKAYLKGDPDPHMGADIYGFNSLQTGKRISRGLCTEAHKEIIMGFNSLQTGKRISSWKRNARND